MPATSKKQYRLFKAVEAGDTKLPGLTPSKAAEMTKGQSQAGLPEQAAKARKRFRMGRKYNFRP
jgi:hypothetical protein